MASWHASVMVDEVLDALKPVADGFYLDCTVGDGGHTLAIMNAAPGTQVLAMDLDSDSLKRSRKTLNDYLNRVTIIQGNFSDVANIVRRNGISGFDGVLFDLGISSMQVEDSARGFSFRWEARMDMRFDRSAKVTAYEVVNKYPERELADIIYRFGEEKKAYRVARAIVANRPVDTTTELAEVVAKSVGVRRGQRIHPATRTFQAIRMAVNAELDNVKSGLMGAIDILKTGGRLAVISYHSVEDRIVKHALRRESSGCICAQTMFECRCDHFPAVKLLNRRVIRPSNEEVRRNPRSRSAKLRSAERLEVSMKVESLRTAT